MKKLLFPLIILILFSSCTKSTEAPVENKTNEQTTQTEPQKEEKKAVDKEISILFKGEIMSSYSDKNGNHPFNVICRVRTYSDCPELKIYYRYTEEEEWTIGKTSADAESISSSRIEIKHTLSFYPKKSIYFMIELEGKEIASFGKWLPKEAWSNDYESFYTVYE